MKPTHPPRQVKFQTFFRSVQVSETCPFANWKQYEKTGALELEQVLICKKDKTAGFHKLLCLIRCLETMAPFVCVAGDEHPLCASYVLKYTLKGSDRSICLTGSSKEEAALAEQARPA